MFAAPVLVRIDCGLGYVLRNGIIVNWDFAQLLTFRKSDFTGLGRIEI
jgi:hypothetical protein